MSANEAKGVDVSKTNIVCAVISKIVEIFAANHQLAITTADQRGTSSFGEPPNEHHPWPAPGSEAGSGAWQPEPSELLEPPCSEFGTFCGSLQVSEAGSLFRGGRAIGQIGGLGLQPGQPALDEQFAQPA